MPNTKIQQFAQILADSGVDAFFAQTPVTMGYLSGFFEDGHERFLTFAVHRSGKSRLICPDLSRIQAERLGIEDIRSWRDGENYLELFAELADDWDLDAAILAIDDHMPGKMLIEMQDVLTRALFKPGGMIVAAQMGRKDQAELQLMHAAGTIADTTYDFLLGAIKVGMSEVEVQHLIENEMRRQGGVPAFCSVCFGPNAAESHHLNDQTVLQPNTLVLVDFGCAHQGYHCDITRVFAIGSATEEQKEIYRVVYAAHEAGRQTAKEGALPCNVDAATRKVIADAGYGPNFNHRTGHGIGMLVHEAPNISPDNSVPLEVGNCFSIEPGIYLAGKFGIRLENLYACEKDGSTCFNQPIAPELLELPNR
ncbi:MAG: M24 family metallopeptidase [Fimbriimonas sp.]